MELTKSGTADELGADGEGDSGFEGEEQGYDSEISELQKGKGLAEEGEH